MHTILLSDERGQVRKSAEGSIQPRLLKVNPEDEGDPGSREMSC